MIDYIDEDVAYLMGMIYARGEFFEKENVRSFNITLENTSLKAQGINSSFTHRDEIIISLSRTKERISEILETDLRQKETENSIILYARFTKSTIGWRDLRLLTDNKFSHHDFIIPDFFFDLEKSIKEQFLKGFCDVAGYIRQSNADQAGIHRIYLQISNKNWILPIQICRLLQVDFNIPVQSIQWGHPNTREPHKTKVPNTATSWAKEHQIRINANEFNIGFSFNYKQTILKEFADFNLKKGKKKTLLCYPNKESKASKKPKHPCESSHLLPECLRNQHFNNYRSICKSIGCKQRKPRSNQLGLKLKK